MWNAPMFGIKGCLVVATVDACAQLGFLYYKVQNFLKMIRECLWLVAENKPKLTSSKKWEMLQHIRQDSDKMGPIVPR